MYEELVKRLRKYAKEHCPLDRGSGICGCIDARETADAIEELSLIAESNERSAAMWAETAGKAVEQIPCWIPVTERLPENCTDVLAYIERNAWGDEDAPYRKREIAIGYHVNGMWHVDGCSGVDCISWQALPEPPKEEV